MKWTLLAVIILTTVAGDLLQSREMRSASAGNPAAPGLDRVLELIVSRRYLLLAMLSMAVSFFAFLALVQTEPISFAVPASAGSFILETVLARFVLGERIGMRRGAGAVLVACGILLVAR